MDMRTRDRPAGAATLAATLHTVRALASQSRYADALCLCDWLIDGIEAGDVNEVNDAGDVDAVDAVSEVKEVSEQSEQSGAAPTAADAWRQRAALRSQLHDRPGAVADMQAVTAMCDRRPADFHALGTLLLRGAATAPAIAAFDRAITLCEESGAADCLHAALLYRASAHLKLAHLAAALRDAMRLPPGYGGWVPGEGMRAKEELLSAAHAALERRRAGRPWAR